MYDALVTGSAEKVIQVLSMYIQAAGERQSQCQLILRSHESNQDCDLRHYAILVTSWRVPYICCGTESAVCRDL